MAKNLKNIPLNPQTHQPPQLDKLKRSAGKKIYMGEKRKAAFEFPADLYIDFHTKALKNKTNMTTLIIEFMEGYIDQN